MNLKISPLLGLLLASVVGSKAHADSTQVSINPSVDPTNLVPLHQTEPHSRSFTVEIKNPPKSNEETEITGPIYKWSGGNDHFIIYYPDNAATVYIGSKLPTNYATSGVLADYGGKAGDEEFNVSCEVTFTEKNKKTKVEKPLKYPASSSGKVLFLKPKKIEAQGPTYIPYVWKYKVPDGTPDGREESHSWMTPVDFQGPVNVGGYPVRVKVFGVSTRFEMTLKSQIDTPYSYGVVTESFSDIFPAGYEPNGGRPGSMWPSPSFTDFIQVISFNDSEPPPPQKPINPSVAWAGFTQNWKHTEYTYIPQLPNHTVTIYPTSVVRDANPSISPQ